MLSCPVILCDFYDKSFEQNCCGKRSDGDPKAKYCASLQKVEELVDQKVKEAWAEANAQVDEMEKDA